MYSVIAILKSHDPNGGTSLAKSLQSAWLYISYNHAKMYIMTLEFHCRLTFLFRQKQHNSFQKLEKFVSNNT